MNIILLLVVTVFLLAFTGWGAYRVCVRPEDAMPTGTVLVFGYSLSIVLFFPLYFLVGDAYATVYGILLLALLINAFVFVRLWRSKALYLPNSSSIKKHGIAYVLFIGVVLIASIPYLFSGVGNYWHTANEDVIDGLNGRNVYLKNQMLDNGPAIERSTRSTLTEQVHPQPNKSLSIFHDRVVNEPGRLQYSSLAFFSALLDLPKGMDVFVIQALLNLGFFALGVYAFVRHVFLQKTYIAVLAAIFSTVGNFYFTTYMNGHIGSLIYNAAIPFILYFVVIWVRDRLLIGNWLVVPITMLMMVLLAYPYPLAYVAIPVAVYAALSWWVRRSKHSIIDIFADRRIQIVVVILFVLGFVIVYQLADPIRLKALSQFRSWGTALNHVGFLQFWGLWPSDGAILTWLDSQPILKVFSLITASVLSVLSLFGFYRLFKQGVTFVAVCIPLWIYFFLVMRFAVYDSYYVYKFLYINAWIVFSATAVAIGYLIEKKHFFLRMAGTMTLLVWLIPNAIYDASALWGVSQRPYNQHSSSYYKVLEAPHSVLRDTYIDIPDYNHSDIARQILGEADIPIRRGKAEAQFILKEKGLKDIYSEKSGEIVWESEIHSITKKPEHDAIELANYWQPEDGGSGKLFRWVSGGRIGSVLVDVQQRSQDSDFMYVCGESGPSIEFRPIELKVFDAKRKLAGAMVLSTYGCHWVNISTFQSPFSLEHAEQGKVVSYIDNRILIYRIMHIGFASANSADMLPQELPLTEDIYTTTDRQTGSHVSLGQNWYPFEKFGGENFRWVNNGAEALLNEVGAKGTLVIEAEPGPSAGHPIKLQIADRSGKVLGDCSLEGRKTCTLPLEFNSPGNHRLQIKSNASGTPVSGDPRILNFRVFKIGWENGKNPVDQQSPEAQLTEDIYMAGKSATDGQTKSQVTLGQNWYPFEKFGGDTFRWVNNGAEVLLNEVGAKGTLVIEAEPGPSAGHPIKLQIANRGGKVLGGCILKGRKVCKIPLQLDSAGNHYLQIKSDAAGQHIATDPRVLNFRIFRLEWKS